MGPALDVMYARWLALREGEPLVVEWPVHGLPPVSHAHRRHRTPRGELASFDDAGGTRCASACRSCDRRVVSTPTPAPPELSLRADAESLDAWMDSVRRKHNIPAMGAIVFRADTVLARGLAGVRRSNSAVPVDVHDRFQLGSNTKAITATVLATLVEEGKLSWTTTLADVFPEQRDSMSAEFRAVTIDLLLFASCRHFRVRGHRRQGLQEHPASFRNSSAAARRVHRVGIARQAGGSRWKRAVLERRLHRRGSSRRTHHGRRVGNRSCALVSSSSVGLAGVFFWSDSADVNQPWGHYETRNGTKPVDPRDRDEQLPAIIWPAGSVELSLDDYARFLQVHLRGLEGRDTPLLKAGTIKHLHASPVTPPDKYALGWGIQT